MTEPHPLDIPACLLLTAEQRCAGWKRQPPKPMPAFGRELTETERLYLHQSSEKAAKKSRRAGEARAVEAGQSRAC